MRIFMLLLLLHAPSHQLQDTSKIKKLYQKIDLKTIEFDQQVSKPKHSIDDIYQLVLKMHGTLKESHGLSRLLLLKEDSTAMVIAGQKAYITEILDRTQTLQTNQVTNAEFREEMEIEHNFLKNAAYIVSVGSLLLFLIRVGIYSKHKDDNQWDGRS